MKENREEYQNEKEKREKRLLAYADMIQSAVQQDSSEVIRQLVEERKRQKLTQQELSDITGVRTSNIARFEGGTRIPTLLMLEKYSNELVKNKEVSIRDKEKLGCICITLKIITNDNIIKGEPKIASKFREWYPGAFYHLMH